ncbi:MAG: FxsA cytoplasmic rane protein [Frankiales bacterium]|nr:FxsA cytoplasmic rane protein [Frankiales bacterium]
MRVPVVPLLVGALVVVPLVELYVLLQVGDLIGAPWTILLLVADSLLGGYLLRREGRRTWSAFRAASSRGGVPATEVADGALVVLGGALMLTPGFVTDVFGLLCVLPPSRRVLRGRLLAAATRRVARAARQGRVSGPGVVDHEP